MAHVVEKARSTGNPDVLVTERGFMLGYQNLVADMRALPVLAATGCPVVFDATHSVQRPGGLGTASGGDRAFVAPLARAAVAVGVDAVFLEVHEDPDRAPSDGPTSVPLDALPTLLAELVAVDRAVRARSTCCSPAAARSCSRASASRGSCAARSPRPWPRRAPRPSSCTRARAATATWAASSAATCWSRSPTPARARRCCACSRSPAASAFR